MRATLFMKDWGPFSAKLPHCKRWRRIAPGPIGHDGAHRSAAPAGSITKSSMMFF